MKTLGSFLVVELMRQGKSPSEACREAVLRIKNKIKDYSDFQVGFIAVNKNGAYGAYAVQSGFEFTMSRNKENKLIESDAYLKKD